MSSERELAAPSCERDSSLHSRQNPNTALCRTLPNDEGDAACGVVVVAAVAGTAGAAGGVRGAVRVSSEPTSAAASARLPIRGRGGPAGGARRSSAGRASRRRGPFLALRLTLSGGLWGTSDFPDRG